MTLLFNNNVIGQDNYSKYKRIVKDGLINDMKVDSLMNDSERNNDLSSYREIAHRYGIFLTRKRKFKKAIHYILLEIQNFEQSNIITHKYTNALYVSGRFHFNNKEFIKAIEFYKRVIELNNITIRSGQSYCEIGRNYNEVGNFQLALYYFEKGINILQSEKEIGSLITQSINYVNLLKDINSTSSLEKSFNILKNADSLANTVNLSRRNRLSLIDAMARQYEAKNNYNFIKAKQYYYRELNLAKKYEDSLALGRIYNNLGYLYNIDKNDSARYFLDIGLKYAISNNIEARINDNYADYYLRNANYRLALKNIHLSLEIMLGSEVDVTPSAHQLNNSIQKDYTLYCLKKKAEIYLRLYSKNQNKDDLHKAIKNIESAEYVVNLLLNGTTEESTQLIWRREASQAYLYGAYAAHLLGDSETAFSFMEKNKALLLSEGVLKNTEFANLPKHISDQETELKKQIYELENTLSKDEDNSIFQDSLFDAKLYHEKYVDSLKTIYPKYFARKINVAQVPLSEVQKEIKNDQAVVSYIWNDFDSDKELIIGFLTTKEKSITFEIENVEELKDQISAYQNLVSKPFSTKADEKLFQKVAFELYQNLFPSEEIRKLINGKDLLIIPDGNLQNIPFESLITQEDSNEYLILNGNINYSYSYSFLNHNEKVERKTTEDFIGYSPVDFNTMSLSNLKNSKEEVEQINVELEGSIRLQDTATKEDFLKNSSDSKIIHLATHADAGENPWIAFADGKMELHELYTYKNNADLVTLSACNTSLGEVAKGEGVLSLARGFFYSGSKSVVSSLWEVNDKSTSKIMTNFYKNLKEGQTKSEAINNAKRDYLSSHSLSEQSPYYWSSFILIGDAGTVDISNNYSVYFFLIAAVLLAFMFFRKKIKIFG